jgi:tetratricopeptide (TPR) repeat protein
VREAPGEAERANVEIELTAALEEIGQQAISDYVRLPLTQIKPDAFSRAAAAFGYLQKFRPKDAGLEERRLFCEGRALLMQRRTADALARLERAYRLNPRAAYTLNAIGLAYEDARVYDKALEAFKRAAELAPHWSLPRTHIGNVYLMQGKFDKSEEELRRAVELDPQNPDPRLLLGNVYVHRNKFDRAEAELRRALELSPRSIAAGGDARYLLGVTYRRQGRLLEAERELTEVIKARPNYAGAYQELGLIYEAARHYAQAAEAFENYLRLEPAAPYRDEIRRRAQKNREEAGRAAPTLKRN